MPAVGAVHRINMRQCAPNEVEHWSLTTLREMLVKTGAKVVSQAGYVTYQLAEFAVPTELFQKILRLIDGLRRPLCRHDGAPSSSIQIARQARYVLCRQGHALSPRNDHRAGFSIGKAAR